MKRSPMKRTLSAPPPLIEAVLRPNTSTAHVHEKEDTSPITVREVVESGVLAGLNSQTSVVVLLAAFAYRERREVPNHDQLALIAGVSRKAIGPAVRELEDNHLLIVDRDHAPHRLVPLPLPHDCEAIPEGVDAARLEASARRAEHARRRYCGVTYRSDLERAVALALDVARVPYGYEVPYRALFRSLPETDMRTMDFLLAPALGLEVAGYADPEYESRLDQKIADAKRHGFTLLVITESTLGELLHLPASVVEGWKSYPLASGDQFVNALAKAKHATLGMDEAKRRVDERRRALEGAGKNCTPGGVYMPPKMRLEVEARERLRAEQDARPVSAATQHLLDPLEAALKSGRHAVALAEDARKPLLERGHTVGDLRWGLWPAEEAMRMFAEAEGNMGRFFGRLTSHTRTPEEDALRLRREREEDEADRGRMAARRAERQAAAAAAGLPDPYVTFAPLTVVASELAACGPAARAIQLNLANASDHATDEQEARLAFESSDSGGERLLDNDGQSPHDVDEESFDPEL